MDFIFGIIVGAIFSPFWMKLWGVIKDKVLPTKE
jgi:hypothetical protein